MPWVGWWKGPKCQALIGLRTKSNKNKMYGPKWRKCKMYGLKVHLRQWKMALSHPILSYDQVTTAHPW